MAALSCCFSAEFSHTWLREANRGGELSRTCLAAVTWHAWCGQSPFHLLQAQCVHGTQWLLRSFAHAKASCLSLKICSFLTLQLHDYILYMHIHTMEWNTAMKMMLDHNVYLSWTGRSELHSVFLMCLYKFGIVHGSSKKVLGNSARVFHNTKDTDWFGNFSTSSEWEGIFLYYVIKLPCW